MELKVLRKRRVGGKLMVRSYSSDRLLVNVRSLQLECTRVLYEGRLLVLPLMYGSETLDRMVQGVLNGLDARRGQSKENSSKGKTKQKSMELDGVERREGELKNEIPRFEFSRKGKER